MNVSALDELPDDSSSSAAPGETTVGEGDRPPLIPSSKLSGPIEELGFLQKSLLFAELSLIAYQSRSTAGEIAAQMGLPDVRFYDRDGAQAYIFGNETDAIVTCRGTEPHEWNDLQADLDAVTAVAETVGRVHRGFKREVDDLWPRLEQALVGNTRTLWFTGHSLGGAMATICAGRCVMSTISSNPRALFTYGSPRVGNRRYVNYVRLEHYRWVNNNDVVTRVPPAWFGYRHNGKEIYLSSRGKIRRFSDWFRFRDRMRGLMGGLLRWEIDYLSDHYMTEYLKHIARAAAEEERSGKKKQFDPGMRRGFPRVGGRSATAADDPPGDASPAPSHSPQGAESRTSP